MAGRRIEERPDTRGRAGLRRDRGDPARDHGSARICPASPPVVPWLVPLRSSARARSRDAPIGVSSSAPIAVVSPVTGHLRRRSGLPLGGPARRSRSERWSGRERRSRSPERGPGHRPTFARPHVGDRSRGSPDCPGRSHRPCCSGSQTYVPWGGRPRRSRVPRPRCGSRGDVVDRRPRRCASFWVRSNRRGAVPVQRSSSAASSSPRSEGGRAAQERWSTREAPRSAWYRS